MDIVACTDSGFVMPTGVMMYSICVNNKDAEIVFHIVTNGLSSEDKEKLSYTVSQFSLKSIIFYDMEQIDFSEIPPIDKGRHWTIVTYFRLFLTEILPSNIEKVLYLDGDIIVRQSLKPLWETNLDNFAIAAVLEASYMKDEIYERLKYPKTNGYFNAGVCLINLSYWRKNNLLSLFKAFMKEHADRILLCDQDVLNSTLWNCWKSLPIKYNLHTTHLCSCNHYESFEYHQRIMEAIDDCVILHYTGGANPWFTTCRHPFRSSFFKYQAQTVWKDINLKETRSLTLRIKKFFSRMLRKYGIIPELPPYGAEFISGLTPLD